MRVEHHALQVRGVLVVLEGPLHEAGLLAELADVGAVVMREHVHLQDGLRDLRRLLQVHREQLRLQRGLVGPVSLQGLEQDRRGLLQPVLLHEDFDDHIHVDERLAVRRVQQVLREVRGGLRVGHEHLLKQLRVVRLVADLLHVGQNLVVLGRLREARDDLLVHTGPQVDGEGKARVQGLHEVTELLSALELVFLQPLLDELPALLLHHGADQLDGFQAVELAAMLQQHREVGQDGRGLAGRAGDALELVDDLRRAEDAALALRCDGGGVLVVPRGEVPGELLLEELVRACQAEAAGQGEGDVLPVGQVHQFVRYVVHDGLLVHLHRRDGALAVDEDAAAG
mmetsp:Transcript_88548/g.255375  ORF Transcript_88548/g.255375 Transcript_88548/m.255375 type:complete len:341 (-) Transcript_88548:1135-2157(-)